VIWRTFRHALAAAALLPPQFERALLALQGPQAVTALARLLPGVEQLVFMTGMAAQWQGADLYVTRSGYTGEDGFEISLPAPIAEAFARALLAQPEVKPVGLGARNSLRLEAGLCLYGNDIDTQTTPVEAQLNWAIQKVRRNGGARAGGFPGAAKILAQLDGSAPLQRVRVGLVGLERIPVREHVELHNAEGEKNWGSDQWPAGPKCRQARGIGLCAGKIHRDGHPSERHGSRQSRAHGSQPLALRAQPLSPRLKPQIRACPRFMQIHPSFQISIHGA